VLGMIDVIGILEAIEANVVYLVALSFFAWYPLVSSGVLVLVSMLYYLRRERRAGDIQQKLDPSFTPMVSVVIDAYNESEHIQATIDGVVAIDYPNFEVVIIDDGSVDNTSALVLAYVRDQSAAGTQAREREQAMALNDGLRCTSSNLP
jgi:biofilm PGA synthesis N-glycosyltransferase PgaC